MHHASRHYTLRARYVNNIITQDNKLCHCTPPHCVIVPHPHITNCAIVPHPHLTNCVIVPHPHLTNCVIVPHPTVSLYPTLT